MDIKIPKVLKEIRLSEYHADFGARAVVVWVNPTRAVGKRRAELMSRSLRLIGKNLTPGPFPNGKGSEEGEGSQAEAEAKVEAEAEELNAGLWAWYAEIWSQGADVETHWTLAEIQGYFEASPDFVRWLIERTNALFLQQREQGKKA